MRYLKCIVFALVLVTSGMVLEGKTQEMTGGKPGMTETALQYLDEEATKAYYASDYTTALAKWRFALNLARISGDRSAIGYFLSVIGMTNTNLARYQQALEASEEALAIRRETHNRQGEGIDLSNIAIIYAYLGQYHRALEFYHQALLVRRELGDRQGEARELGNIALAHTNLQQYQQALDYAGQALVIERELGDRYGEGVDLNNFGVIHMKQGQYQQALDYFQQSLTIRREIGDRQGEGVDVNDIGRVYGALGEYQQALEHFQQALVIARETGNRRGASDNLSAIGIIYWHLGQPDEALKYYEHALEIDRAIGNIHGEATTLDNMGVVYGHLQQYQEALNYFQQALTIERGLDDRHGQGGTLINIGMTYRNLGQYQQALEHFQQALALKREIGDRRGEGVALLNLGAVYGEMEQYQDASTALHSSIEILSVVGNRGFLWKAQRELASIEVRLHQPESAIMTYGRALDNIETLRAGLSEKEYKLSFMQTTLYVYDELITLFHDLHQQQPDEGYDRKALEIFERKQGRVFLEEMGQSGARLFAGLPETMTQQERDLDIQLDQVRNRLIDERAKPVAEQQRERMNDLERQEKALQTERESLQATIENEYPDYYALRYPQPADLSNLQNSVLRPGELMLVYAVMSERICLWLIGQQEFGLYSIDLGEDALAQQVAGLRDTLMREWGIGRGLNLSGQTDQKQENPSSFARVSHNLYKMLIPEAVRPLLTGQHALNIVPTGPLYALPFEVLVTSPSEGIPLSSSGRETMHYLIEDIPISYLSSASLLKTIREGQARRSPSNQYPLLAFANPAYHITSQDTDRLQALRSQSYRALLDDVFAELPETADEAKAIADLLQAPRESAPLQLRENASWQNVVAFNAGGRLDDYAYLLFATHGIMPGEVDRITQSALVLSDNYLTMADVFGLQLNAKLVALSAWNTGRGAQVRGEGVMGLTRAFMYAGTPTVAVTRWSVESLSAKDLDIGFFRFLKEGFAPARALQAVKVQMLRGEHGEEYRNPYYWAPFVIFGDGM